MADVVFEDFTIKVLGAVDTNINAALEEVAAELESAVKRNQDKFNKTGQTSGGWEHHVDPVLHEAVVGNSRENALWEEFGTGEHAVNGDGRPGYWVFVKGSGGKSKKLKKYYTLDEAKKVMAILRSKGLEAYYTNGKKPRRHFQNAINAKKSKLIKRLQNCMKGN